MHELRKHLAVMNVRPRGCDAMNDAGFGVYADVRFHPKVPLVAFLGLMHLGVTLAARILGRTGSRNDRRCRYRDKTDPLLPR